jgi:hypothetical protein
MSEIRKYRVTDTASPWAGGRRREPGDVVEMTEEQARYEVLAGHLVEVTGEPAAEAGAGAAKSGRKAG